MKNDIQEFEKTILDPEKTGDVKYRVDLSMEASVRYQFLCESYGKERIDELLSKNNLSITDLCTEEKFKEITSMLFKK